MSEVYRQTAPWHPVPAFFEATYDPTLAEEPNKLWVPTPVADSPYFGLKSSVMQDDEQVGRKCTSTGKSLVCWSLPDPDAVSHGGATAGYRVYVSYEVSSEEYRLPVD